MNWIYQFDMSTFREVNVGFHSTFLDPVFHVLTLTGEGEVQFILCLVFLLSTGMRRFVLPLLTTILFAGLAVAGGLKSIFPRDRPSNLYFAIPEDHLYASSFPSGHTTTSFAVATMLLLLTRKSGPRWAGPVALVWAAFVGMSRIYRGVHWPTDVIAGACCGVFSACLVYALFRWRGADV